MDDDIFFADCDRGIYGSRKGNLYITKPNTSELKDDPFVVPYPYRIVVKKNYDPFLAIFTESGYIYILNYETLRWHLKALLPPQIGLIDSLKITNNGESVILKSSQYTYSYQGGWVNLSIPVESLIIKEDQKIFAQATQLENEVCTAKLCGDYKKFKTAMKSYLVCLASFTSNEVFIPIWYDLISQKYPFNPDKIHKFWTKCINMLSTGDRLSHFTDEMKMSIGIK